jgi:hypothetical protein
MGNDFTLNLQNFAVKFNIRMETVIRKVTLDAFTNIVNMTPVDTGRARANWGCSKEGHTLIYDVGLLDKDGFKTLEAIGDKVTAWKCEGSIYLTNNLPYIGALEYGHSKQAPAGMVRLTIEQVRNFVEQAVKR